MKRLLLIIGILAISGSVYAKTQTCPFVDHFTIMGPSNTAIASLSTTGNLKYQQQGTLKFTTSCADDNGGNNGTVTLKVQQSTANYCQLRIVDGPYEMNPRVTSSTCQGKLQYAGMDHVLFSYDYTLKFAGKMQYPS